MKKVVLEQVKNKTLSIEQAALQLEMSKRNVLRLKKRFVANGLAGLIHKSRGRESSKKIAHEVRDQAIKLYFDQYDGAGPTYFCQQLKKSHKINISKETARFWLNQAGAVFRKRKRSVYRSMRPRKNYSGELWQLDGSYHAWFEDRAQKATLIAIIDDATSQIVHLQFYHNESTETVFQAMSAAFIEHGVPVSMYSDCHSIYRVNNKEARDRGSKSEYEKSLNRLGVKAIHAKSPQAKGRVERTFRTHQDRLVLDLRSRNISTIDEANEYLKEYVVEHNNNYAVKPLLPESKVRRRSAIEIKNAIFIATKHTVQNDHTIRVNNQPIQLHKYQPVRVYPRDKVVVKQYPDGSTKIVKKKKELAFTFVFAGSVTRQKSRPRNLSRSHALQAQNLDSPLTDLRWEKVTKSNC